MPDTTHVANATRYTIWVCCDSDRALITERSQQISDAYSEQHKRIFSHEDSGSGSVKIGKFFGMGGVEVSADGKHSESNHNEDHNSRSSQRQAAFKQVVLNVANSKGFTKVTSGDYAPFATTGELVFVTIFIEAGPNEFESICTAHSIHCDRSIIIRFDGQIRLQRYGDGLFTDENGVDLLAVLRRHLREAPKETQQTPSQEKQKSGGGGGGSSNLLVSVECAQHWGSAGDYKLVFQNTGSRAISGANFRLNLNGLSMDKHWNFESTGAGNEYRLPSWFNLQPGAINRDTGFIGSGQGTPTASINNYTTS